MPGDEIQEFIPHLFFSEFPMNLVAGETPSAGITKSSNHNPEIKAMPCVGRLEEETLAH